MDAIGDINVRVSLNLWGGQSSAPMAFRRMSPLAQIQSIERARAAQENLSKLLFGVDLQPDEVNFYRSRLMKALGLGDAVEHLEEELPEVKPREGVGGRGSYQVGPMVWTPPPEFQLKPPPDAISVSPIHQVHTASLLERHNLCGDCGLARGPGQEDCGQCGAVERQTVKRVGIMLAAGGEVSEVGADTVDMSYKGLQQAMSPQAEKLLTSRMPPRFMSRVEAMQLSRAA